MELRGWAPEGSSLRASMKALHFSLGLCVLLTVAARLAVRWTAGAAPPIVPALSATQGLLARLGHVALYAFLIAMPILGWLTLSAAGKPILLFGAALPALMAPDEALASQVKALHETLATIGYFLMGLHAAAALAHHYLRHDNTLVRMLASRRKNGGNR
jgi:cytochrome b561